MSTGKSVWENLISEVRTAEIDNSLKKAILENIEKLKSQSLDILIVGATGVGKSSTINAIFDMEIAETGDSSDPETFNIARYEFDNLTLWDTPGLGDSPENDAIHSQKIASILSQTNSKGNALIDIVLVIIDASMKDMGTTYELIEKVIVPSLSDKSRILLAVNQCDMAQKGRGWNKETGLPSEELTAFLNGKIESVKNRLYDSTGIKVSPVFYSALYKYNISKLLNYIVSNVPDEKRLILADNINKSHDIWQRNDNLADYNMQIQSEMKSSITRALESAAKGAIAGATIGNLVPIIGPIVGASIGAVLGFFGTLLE